jgi:biotin synthase
MQRRKSRWRSREAILLCFLGGANSIFTGERLLTTPNPASNEDAALLQDLGLKAMQLPH